MKMNKICSKCNREWPDEFLACPLCGTVLTQGDGATNVNLNLGDANAISGGVSLSDSHAVTNNTANTTTNHIDSHDITTNNITKIEREKSPEEIRHENELQFREACQEVYSDRIMTSEEKRRLDDLQIKLGIDEETAARIISDVSKKSVRKSAILSPVHAISFNNIKTAIVSNNMDVVERLKPQLRAMAQKYSSEEIQYVYYMLQAILHPSDCVKEYHTHKDDKYWQTFWTSVAYRKLGDVEKSELLVMDVGDKWIDTIPQENIFILASMNAILDGDMETAKILYDNVTGEHSPHLAVLVGCLYTLFYRDIPQTDETKKMAEDGVFYKTHLFKNAFDFEESCRDDLEDTCKTITGTEYFNVSSTGDILDENVQKKVQKEQKKVLDISPKTDVVNNIEQDVEILKIWADNEFSEKFITLHFDLKLHKKTDRIYIVAISTRFDFEQGRIPERLFSWQAWCWDIEDSMSGVLLENKIIHFTPEDLEQCSGFNDPDEHFLVFDGTQQVTMAFVVFCKSNKNDVTENEAKEALNRPANIFEMSINAISHTFSGTDIFVLNSRMCTPQKIIIEP